MQAAARLTVGYTFRERNRTTFLCPTPIVYAVLQPSSTRCVQFCRMLLPEMAGGGEGHRRRRSTQQREQGGADGSESPRHIVMTAKSGGWAASGAAYMLSETIQEDD